MPLPAASSLVLQTVELEAPPVAAPLPTPELIRWEVGTVDGRPKAKPNPFPDFHAARTVGEALEALFGSRTPDRQAALDAIARLCAAIDAMLTDQLNAILHHRSFQALEASWRGLEHLTLQAVELDPDGPPVKVKVLNVSWREVERDFERANDYDQSQLFSKIYDDAFGMPGGKPFGVMLGDFEIRPNTAEPSDVDVLQHLSRVAAAAFCPFIAAASPEMIGLTRFTDMEASVPIERIYEQPNFIKWGRLRQTDDSRFVALTLPHVLMRLPYSSRGDRTDGFDFREDTSAPDRLGYLWGNAAYAMGGVLIRSFQQSNWLSDTSGVKRGQESGGLVVGLPAQSVETDPEDLIHKFSTDLLVDDHLERELSEYGFLPLSHLQGTQWMAFLSSTTIHKPQTFDRPIATMNARLCSYLRYVLCVSRFAHYLKVLARDRIGQLAEAGELEAFLNRWVSNYVTGSDDVDDETRAKRPLREAEVSVRPRPGAPGAYDCTFFLRPHFEMESISAGLRLETRLVGIGQR